MYSDIIIERFAYRYILQRTEENLNVLGIPFLVRENQRLCEQLMDE